jgi:hypothetical protein
MSQKQFKFELVVNHSVEHLSVQIKFSGSEIEGIYDLSRPSNKGERHKWKAVALKSSDWKMLCNTIFLARLDELPEVEPEGEWDMMDGAYFTVNIQANETRFSRTRHANPERRFRIVVNEMIDLVPQLDEEVKPDLNLKDYYKFSV